MDIRRSLKTPSIKLSILITGAMLFPLIKTVTAIMKFINFMLKPALGQEKPTPPTLPVLYAINRAPLQALPLLLRLTAEQTDMIAI